MEDPNLLKELPNFTPEEKKSTLRRITTTESPVINRTTYTGGSRKSRKSRKSKKSRKVRKSRRVRRFRR